MRGVAVVLLVSCLRWLFMICDGGRAQTRPETFEVRSLSSRVFVGVYGREPGQRSPLSPHREQIEPSVL